MSDDDLLSRSDILAGRRRLDRRPARLLALIEVRCAYMRRESRRAIEAYLLGEPDDYQREYDFGYLQGLRLQADLQMPLTVADLEHYAHQWMGLIPDDPALRANLIHLIAAALFARSRDNAWHAGGPGVEPAGSGRRLRGRLRATAALGRGRSCPGARRGSLRASCAPGCRPARPPGQSPGSRPAGRRSHARMGTTGRWQRPVPCRRAGRCAVHPGQWPAASDVSTEGGAEHAVAELGAAS